MSDTIIYYMLMAFAGLATGLFAGYNGLRRNRSDAASSLVNDSLKLVDSLRAELDRIRVENEKSSQLVGSLRAELANVQLENAKLIASVRNIEARIKELDKINQDLQSQITSSHQASAETQDV